MWYEATISPELISISISIFNPETVTFNTQVVAWTTCRLKGYSSLTPQPLHTLEGVALDLEAGCPAACSTHQGPVCLRNSFTFYLDDSVEILLPSIICFIKLISRI